MDANQSCQWTITTTKSSHLPPNKNIHSTLSNQTKPRERPWQECSAKKHSDRKLNRCSTTQTLMSWQQGAGAPTMKPIWKRKQTVSGHHSLLQAFWCFSTSKTSTWAMIICHKSLGPFSNQEKDLRHFWLPCPSAVYFQPTEIPLKSVSNLSVQQTLKGSWPNLTPKEWLWRHPAA